MEKYLKFVTKKPYVQNTYKIRRARGATDGTDGDRWRPMALGRPHSVWRKMARATRSGVGAGSSRVTAESTAAAGPAPPPPLALPAPPHSRGARVGQGRPMTRDAVARGDPLFKENPSGQSRRDAHHALGEPKVRGSHLRRVGLGTPRAGGDKH